MENGRAPLINARVLRAGSRCHRNRSTGLIAAGLLRAHRLNLRRVHSRSKSLGPRFFFFFFEELSREGIFRFSRARGINWLRRETMQLY